MNKERNQSEQRGIWVFAEQKEGRIEKVAYELLQKARTLADQCGESVVALLVGYRMEPAVERLIWHGADTVFRIEHPILAGAHDEAVVDAILGVVKKHMPVVLLFGGTAFGRSIAPRIASALDTGLTADCTRLDIDRDTGRLLQTRPAFGGGLMATIVCENHRPQMATVRPNVLPVGKQDRSRTGQTILIDYSPKEFQTAILDVETTDEDSSLTDAKIIVGAGRGIQEAKTLDLVRQLAKQLGAAVGVSRAVVDAGWADYKWQIGQTGTAVAPDVYVACGISGAVQHLAGIMSARKIIAINKDKDAPIFQVAHCGLVGDLQDILPQMIRHLQENKEE